MTEPLAIPVAQAASSAEGDRGSTAPDGEVDSRQPLVEIRDALLRLLEAVPPDLPAIQSLFRTQVADAPIDIISLEAAGEVPFLSRPSWDPVVLVVAPRPDRVCLAVQPALPANLLGLALLHGLGHVLLGHVRPGDRHGHHDTAVTLRGGAGGRRWDRQVGEAFAPWFDAAFVVRRPDWLPETPEPHQVQQEALAALQATREIGNTAGLVVLATGLGKTWLSAFDSSQPQFRRLLFVAHREEILDQARATYRLIRPQAKLGFYNGTEKIPDAEVVFASIQTLSRVQHLRNFAADAFDYIVIDEFHHAVAGTYQRLLDHFTPRFLLGLTATPERMDGGDLLALCQENLVYRCDLADGIRRGLLSPFRYFGVPDEVDYRNIPWRSTRFDEQALTDAVATNSRAANVLEQYRKRAGKRTLAFCCSQRHADFTADYFRRERVRAVAVHSGGSSAARATSLEQLEAGKLDVVCAVDMFNEGVDLPLVDTVMMLRPTESPVIWLQQFGRGLRKALGKDRLTVIDYIGNHRSFLLKVRALFNDVASDADIAGILTMASANRFTGLPPGCEVTYDLQAIDILKSLLRIGTGSQLIEAYYRDFRERHGIRPRAVETLHDGYNPRSVHKAHGSWLRFVDSQGDLTAGQKQLPQQATSFLEVLETTPMTKSFKILLLQAMLNHDALPGAIDIGALVQGFARLARRSAVLRAEVGEDLDDSDRLRAYLERNPVSAWVEAQGTKGTAYFAYDGGSFRSTFSVPEDARGDFQELVRERIDWRLVEYLQRGSAVRQEGNIGFTAKVKRSGSRPMIFLPKREANPEVPEGPTRLIVNDQNYTADFVKIALNVIKRSEDGENELPGVLSGWFGEDAGAPGTSHLVTFELKEHVWHMRPAGLAGKSSEIALWGHYLRKDIPPLFGLAFSKAIWDVGYVRRGDHVFLLVTLEKKGHVETYQYEDRFLGTDLFQWQSQNRTKRDSPDGRVLQQHKDLGAIVHLFVRRRKKIANQPAPFVYCGPVEFVDWEHETPITVRWRLTETVPETLREALCVPP
jgi:superfamily II DNA or RNA helicase